eukprot:1481125-Pleurochrysis_carterae.AAC.2
MLEGKAPSRKKHAASHVWFDRIFQCRVVDFDGVVKQIDYQVDDRRICGGALAAVYAFPSATFNTIERHVKRGDYHWITYAQTRTMNASEKLTHTMEAEV